MGRFETVENITRAILRGDKKYNGTPLPSPQTSGTGMQQRSYARQKAEQIYDLMY